MENLTFLPFEHTDLPTLESMIFDMYAHNDLPFSQEKIARTIQRASTHPEQLQIKLFKVGEEIVGYAILPAFWSNEYGGLVLIIDELYVMPVHRNKGISTFFIQELAKSTTHVLLQLEVLQENPKALVLYKRVGFEVINRHFMKKVCNVS